MSESHSSVISIRIYLLVYASLLILLGATIGAAFLKLGEFNVIIPIVIAVMKAGLVALFFMHLRYSKAIVVIFSLAGVYWLGILILLTASDFSTR